MSDEGLDGLPEIILPKFFVSILVHSWLNIRGHETI